MFNSNTADKYSKAERDTLNAKASYRKADAQVHLYRVMWFALLLLPVVGILAYVHYYVGYQIVLGILAILGVICVGVIFSWLNDRGQERAMSHSVAMAERMGKGINEAVSQNARTQGEAERMQYRVWMNERMQAQRVDASKQLIEYRNQDALPVFDYENNGHESDDSRFEVVDVY